MEDNLPLEFFKFEYLYSSRKQNRIDLYFSLFPFDMLRESIFNENLSIENRYECLEKGLCYVIIYSICSENYFSKEYKDICANIGKTQVQQMRKTKNCYGITLMDKQTCIKYITLVASLLMQLYQKKDTSIGAYGTHFEEHFFSKLRRISNQDNRTDSFIVSLISNLLLEELSNNNKIKIKVSKRSLSSGVILKSTSVQQMHSFGESFFSILNLFAKFFNLNPFISLFPFDIDDNKEYTFFEYNFPYNKKENNFISTQKTNIVATGGLNPLKNLVSHSQIHNLSNNN